MIATYYVRDHVALYHKMMPVDIYWLKPPWTMDGVVRPGVERMLP